MKTHRLDDMVRGWFVGGFTPTAHSTTDVEVGVKHYPAGAREDAHYHRVATEITLILDGEVTMNGRRFTAGDIVVLAPGEVSDFVTLTSVTTVVVKHPGALDDKYPTP